LLILDYIKDKNSWFDIDFLKEKAKEIKTWYIPKDIVWFINILKHELNINPIYFTPQDYKNINYKKAVLVWNYGARAWRALEK
jgi:hypothetical protein